MSGTVFVTVAVEMKAELGYLVVVIVVVTVATPALLPEPFVV